MALLLDFSDLPSRLNTIMEHTWSSAERAILRTCLYADIFSGTLTQQDLQHYLLSATEHSCSDLTPALSSLFDNPRSSSLLSRVYIGDRNRHFPVQKWREVVFMTRVLAPIPWIQSIWITGSVAVGNVRESDDIDIMFLVAPDRLWITRLLVVALGIVLGKYRRAHHSEKGVQNRWCCNIWLEEDAIALPESRHDVYIAREVIQAVPVYTRWGEDASIWLQQNSWVKQWSKQGFSWALQRAKASVSYPAWSFLSMIPSTLPSALNTVAFWLQMRFIEQKQTREEVTKRVAFFHPSTTQYDVVMKYEKMCREYNV